MSKIESESLTREEEYKYYKIIRKWDNSVSYCPVLNFVDDFFRMMYGVPDKWIESDEMATIKLRNDEILIPVKIEASVNNNDYDIILSKQEYRIVQSRY